MPATFDHDAIGPLPSPRHSPDPFVSMWSTEPQPSAFTHCPPRNASEGNKSRRKEKEPKMYEGKRDLMDYLNYFLKVTKLNGWDYETCGLQLATSLSGDAAEVLSTLPADQSEDLKHLVRALVRRYCPKGREAQYSFELMSRTWNSSKESVTEFANDLAKLARKAYPNGGVPDKIMIDMFKKGLVPSMQMQMHLKPPTNMDEALALAVAMEPFEKPKTLGAGKKPHKGEHVASVDKASKGNKGNNKTPAKTEKQEDKSATAESNDFKRFQAFLKWEKKERTPANACRYCKEEGHWLNDCERLKIKRAKEAEASQQAGAGGENDLN